MELIDHISIYPNPVNNYITIKGLSNNSELEIYSMTGRLMKNQSINNGIINVSDLNSSIFLIKIKRNGELVTTQQIAIQ